MKQMGQNKEKHNPFLNCEEWTETNQTEVIGRLDGSEVNGEKTQKILKASRQL